VEVKVYYICNEKIVKMCDDRIIYETTEVLSINEGIITKYYPINSVEIVYEDRSKRVVRYHEQLINIWNFTI
jgi:hypothetical protein